MIGVPDMFTFVCNPHCIKFPLLLCSSALLFCQLDFQMRSTLLQCLGHYHLIRTHFHKPIH
nr:MAG TPA: hypothetical protein [Caudoviricetes sp.]